MIAARATGLAGRPGTRTGPAAMPHRHVGCVDKAKNLWGKSGTCPGVRIPGQAGRPGSLIATPLRPTRASTSARAVDGVAIATQVHGSPAGPPAVRAGTLRQAAVSPKVAA